MTNFEAVKADLLTYTASRAKIEKELILEGIDPQKEFTPGDQKSVARVVIKILRGFRHLTGESEGGLSNQYDPEKLDKYLLSYAGDNDLADLVDDISPGDCIRDRSDIW